MQFDSSGRVLDRAAVNSRLRLANTPASAAPPGGASAVPLLQKRRALARGTTERLRLLTGDGEPERDGCPNEWVAMHHRDTLEDESFHSEASEMPPAAVKSDGKTPRR